MKHSFLLKLYAVIVVFLIIDWFLPSDFYWLVPNGNPIVDRIIISAMTIIFALISILTYFKSKLISKMVRVMVYTFGTLLFPLVIAPVVLCIVQFVVAFFTVMAEVIYSEPIALSTIENRIFPSCYIISEITVFVSWDFVACLAYSRYRKE